MYNQTPFHYTCPAHTPNQHPVQEGTYASKFYIVRWNVKDKFHLLVSTYKIKETMCKRDHLGLITVQKFVQAQAISTLNYDTPQHLSSYKGVPSIRGNLAISYI